MYPITYLQTVIDSANEYNLDPYLVFGVIKTESAFNPDARSHQDAIGLMQITMPTGKWIAEKMKITNFEEKDLYDPQTNIKMGCWYLNNLKNEFNEDTILTLAAYNAGRGNVNKWLKDEKYSKDGKKLKNIPYKETDEYVKKVQVTAEMYRKLYDLNKENK